MNSISKISMSIFVLFTLFSCHKSYTCTLKDESTTIMYTYTVSQFPSGVVLSTVNYSDRTFILSNYNSRVEYSTAIQAREVEIQTANSCPTGYNCNYTFNDQVTPLPDKVQSIKGNFVTAKDDKSNYEMKGYSCL